MQTAVGVGLSRDIERSADFVLPASANPASPATAEFLPELLARKKMHDAMLGDIQERFVTDHDRYGEKRARLRDWATVIRTIGPLIWALSRKRLGWPWFGQLGATERAPRRDHRR